MINETIQTMIQQLGGVKRLQVMAGAKDFIYDNDDEVISFSVGNNSAGINCADVYYIAAKDLYKMRFFNVSKKSFKRKLISEFDDVYGDQLVEIFERETGMLLTIPKFQS